MAKKNTITKEEVLHIAQLGKIKLSESEVTLFTNQLAAVLDYVDKLQKIDTKNVAPTYQTLDNTKNIFREDKIEKGLSSEEALSQSKRVYNNFFVTEGVFDDYKKETKVTRPIGERKN
jgi:aspartyl-tRNA(Asn)/glutamyl-tRNA(Gln) amidotransferase subunit C